jgi:transcriptional regulator GlxA family with amidase domain
LYVAEKLLITTRLSVDEIMDKAGFSNRGNFYKNFSQKFGMTPKNYRNTKGT